MTIEVMVVDDSAVVRQVVRDMLNDAPDINVFACVADPILARQKCRKNGLMYWCWILRCPAWMA